MNPVKQQATTIFLVLAIIVLSASHVFADKTVNNSSTLPLAELRMFTEAFARIKQDYVEEVDDKTLLENAIRGMLTGLDPHSSYLSPDDFNELQVETSGQFGGLGIEVTMENGFVKVVSPIDDTPAQRAGVEAGDLIIRLDDTPVKGMTLTDAVKIMRGKPGEPILLTIVREGESKPLKITIVRDIIKVKSVKKKILEPNFAYVRITRFQAQTGRHLKNMIRDLEKENKGKLKGLVLDLRNNPGGVLSAAVAVSDAFLNKGLIVYTEGRVADSKLKFQATSGDILNGSPIVVLVNGGSASASEIVAGALQDHKRAVIVGTKTFGKGSVQTILPMNNRAGIKLTTARYYTPSGRSIQAEGIVPDIDLSGIKVTAAKESDIDPIKEADMRGHLENDDEAHKNGRHNKDSTKQTKKTKKENLAVKDYAIHEALTILKGLTILKSN